ncbi:MAG: SdpI family protein [Planctomycetes bacterium]|nr:SdpI family protein [Planctomycetota bacterium]
MAYARLDDSHFWSAHRLAAPRAVSQEYRGFSRYLRSNLRVHCCGFLALHVLFMLEANGTNVRMGPSIGIILGIMFMVLGNWMGKLRRNLYIGIRTPWTIANDIVWEKTHRLGGRLFVAAGIVTVAVCTFASDRGLLCRSHRQCPDQHILVAGLFALLLSQVWTNGRPESGAESPDRFACNLICVLHVLHHERWVFERLSVRDVGWIAFIQAPMHRVAGPRLATPRIAPICRGVIWSEKSGQKCHAHGYH